MKSVWNPTDEVITTVRHGIPYRFEPDESKDLDDNIANFIHGKFHKRGIRIITVDPRSDNVKEVLEEIKKEARATNKRWAKEQIDGWNRHVNRLKKGGASVPQYPNHIEWYSEHYGFPLEDPVSDASATMNQQLMLTLTKLVERLDNNTSAPSSMTDDQQKELIEENEVLRQGMREMLDKYDKMKAEQDKANEQKKPKK